MRLRDLAAAVAAQVEGDDSIDITRVATLENAGPGSITFFANPRYRDKLATTRAAAVIVSNTERTATTLPKLVSANPYVTYAKVATILHPAPARASGIDPTAHIDSTARVAASVSIGAYAVIGADATIGERVALGAHVVVGDGCSIADDAVLYAGAVLYPRTVVGARTTIHSGAVIGADGFGLAEEGGRWLRIPQLGRVVIGNDVDIGANTTIDRGAIDDTVIEDDVKLDNQIQIGHNCVIGAHTAIAGCVGVAGSTRIGRNCKIGGAAMIAGHIQIADGTIISGATGVYDSIAQAGVYTGTFPLLAHTQWRYVASHLRRLRDLFARIRALERRQKNDDQQG